MDVLREIIPWPRRSGVVNPQGVFDGYLAAIEHLRSAGADGVNDPKLLEAAWKLFDQDGAHRASIDGRAAGMMAAISLAAALVTGVAFTSFRDMAAVAPPAFWTMAATVGIALFYLTATGIGLFVIQGPIIRNTVDPKDLDSFNPGANPRGLAVRVLEYTVKNYKVNNNVGERLFAAQKCFRNALLALVVGGFLTAVLTMVGTSSSSALPLAQTLAAQAGCVDRATLDATPGGGWSGKCLRAGAVSSVRLSPLGQVTFP